MCRYFFQYQYESVFFKPCVNACLSAYMKVFLICTVFVVSFTSVREGNGNIFQRNEDAINEDEIASEGNEDFVYRLPLAPFGATKIVIKDGILCIEIFSKDSGFFEVDLKTTVAPLQTLPQEYSTE